MANWTAATYKWLRHDCSETQLGYRKFGIIRTYVNTLENRTDRHYQRVDIRIDRLAGYDAANPTWRNVDSRDYDWSKFTVPDLAVRSTSGIRTGLGNDAGTFTAKATVTLRRSRSGPDENVWRYRVRSPMFTCSELSGGIR